ncbi:MAG: hypothetical protein A2Y38_11675 [Spirochaetes bacterium GWB1_59_5]|nr:MAG: hypothetical protein A2Y38_11675 [Spirochaetes bacterium GWB1_59_5]
MRSFVRLSTRIHKNDADILARAILRAMRREHHSLKEALSDALYISGVLGRPVILYTANTRILVYYLLDTARYIPQDAVKRATVEAW